jgi:TrmH family RNA methyltransferase
MANFEFTNLYLINPCKLDGECYSRAMHANYILDNAKIFKTFNEAIKNLDYIIATSSIDSKNIKKHLRNSIFLKKASEKIFEINGKVGIVFGREDYGMLNEEIAECDIMVKIPTSEEYKSLNLSHAVALFLYELYVSKTIEKEKRIIDKNEKEKLQDFFSLLLKEIDYPEHKKENTEIMFRRILGRAMPSKWEFHTLMGVFSKSISKIKNKKEKK